MIITGCNLIGNKKSDKGSKTFNVVNPQSGKRLKPFFYESTKEEIRQAAEIANNAFPVYNKTSFDERAKLLETIADEILIIGNKLIQRCHIETALPVTRLENERERTVNQLRMFAKLLRDGTWLQASIDIDDKSNTDIRLTQISLGPIAVFGASNFPFAFSVAGGDTASALAAGCPVIVKANPSHPGTSEMVASTIIKAIDKMNFPEGTFSMLHGQSHLVGLELVRNSFIKAVGFTGSFKGGNELYKAAISRLEPIPVYAEMGSTNPIFIFPENLKENIEKIADDLVESVTLGVGQFCTNPGLIFVVDDDNSKEFIEKLSQLFKRRTSGTMLGEHIKSGYEKGIKEISNIKGLKLVAEGKLDDGICEVRSQLFETELKTFVENKRLEEEVFGPSTIIVKIKSGDEFTKVAKHLKGHLTTSIFANKSELEMHVNLINELQNKAGRIIYNDFPTGLVVCPSMHHGGPFPATSNIRYTSVGTRAIYRFVRPLSFQNMPNELLPDELKDENPLEINRTVNGKLTNEKLTN
jgi:2,5-dioxopentanoate dehydrogenase